ncbi:hypothetical protein H2200_001659 [Cladophialophora chaetospira]|uniref:Uncharacterized protein n=1 Tax=Cladophialophora chaetospira TaxID=386627 RepID=A0AA38XLA6_9EURO|nr:hypothetical protein H2200_001659 [Cladophialophora chaetospira]
MTIRGVRRGKTMLRFVAPPLVASSIFHGQIVGKTARLWCDLGNAAPIDLHLPTLAEAPSSKLTSHVPTNTCAILQSPPLHLHFQQAESFIVLSGEIGTTTTYSRIDTIHTPENTPPSRPHNIPPWGPHRFWPSPNATEDTTIMVWAHPNPTDMEDKMDRLFFQCLLFYVSDISEKKAPLSLLQVMIMQHFSATALIMFPNLWILGPLRWWIPWIFQCICAHIAMWMGYKPLMKKYMSQEEWEDKDVQERVGMRKKEKKDL